MKKQTVEELKEIAIKYFGLEKCKELQNNLPEVCKLAGNGRYYRDQALQDASEAILTVRNLMQRF